MSAIQLGPFSGMNNRLKATALPPDKARNAVNVVFDDANQIVYPAPGKTLRYSGNVAWVHQSKFVTIFLEDGTLKRLNSNNTATSLKTGFGYALPDATLVGDTLYVSNGTGRGKVDASGNYHPWGTPRPPRNPDATATAIGGLHAGEYRVTMTWISDDGEEGGCGIGKRVTVPAGGGISLSNFPAPPGGVDQLAIYVTSVNGKDFYLYGEYDAATSSLTLGRKVCTIPLLTQFGYVPMPNDILTHHYGRIYYWRGSRLYKTATRRLGVQFALQFMRFDANGTVLISVPNSLYVGTEKRVYRVSNLDGDGAPIIEVMLEVGAVKGSVTYDDVGNAYFATKRSLVMATPEGIKELGFDQVAIPAFARGTLDVLDSDGARYLVGVFQDGTQSDLADSAYNTAEVTAGRL